MMTSLRFPFFFFFVFEIWTWGLGSGLKEVRIFTVFEMLYYLEYAFLSLQCGSYCKES